tara:strand:- start:352 stop:993 length:642 start_codon:yes stop_codon:yes gene_type:complete
MSYKEDIQKYFKENSYVVIKDVVDKTTINLFYSYTMKKINRNFYKLKNNPELYSNIYDMTFGAKDSGFNSLNFYGDEFCETILEALLNKMEEFTGLELLPEYGFLRLYQKEDILPYHNDRPSCEISTTLCVGYKGEKAWPIWLENKNRDKIPVNLEPGDMLVYKGCDLFHWRDKYEGENHLQAFLHYNDKNGPHGLIYDGRETLGTPAIKKEK